MDTNQSRSHSGVEELVLPYSLLDERLPDDEDTEQHKALRGRSLHKRPITHYRHATTKWGSALEGFTPLWFAICISSGGIASVLNGPFPYRARWQVTCATILYVTDLALYIIFGAIMLARWILFPHSAVRRALSNPDELGAYAIPPIALMTIAVLTASQVSDGSWGGHAFTAVAYVCWWIGTVWVFATALVLLSSLVYTDNQSDRTMTPVLFMAPVGLATSGAEAGFITIFSEGMSARMAVPQLFVGYFAVGIAIFMAVLLYTIYLHRLLTAGWPVPAKRPALFILIGPCGQLSTALQLLGESANEYMRFAKYKPGGVYPPIFGTFWRQEIADAIDGAVLLLSLLFIGFDLLWFGIAIIGVVDLFVKREATYSLVWWSVVFPTVTLTTAFLELGSAMNSPAFRALTSAMLMFLVIAYFLNLGFTVWGISRGTLVFGKTQAETEGELKKKARELKTEHSNGQNDNPA